MATVDTILVKVEADLRDVKKSLAELERTTKKTTQGVNRSFNRIASTAKAVLGGVIVLQALRAGNALVQIASSAEEMRNKSATVFGAFASDVTKELGTFADATGRSIIELEGMAASVQDTFVPLGFARGEAADLSVQLTKLSTDVASFQNAQDPEVMQAFQSALVGNHEAVRRFGIVITESTLQAELNRMGIRKNINEITNEEKVRARLNLLIAGSTDAIGDAEKTAGSFENRQKAMNAALQDLAVGVLTPLLPQLAELADQIAQNAKELHTFLVNIGLADSGLTGLAEAERAFAVQQEKVLEIQKRVDAMNQLQLQRRGNVVKVLEAEKLKLAELGAELQKQSIQTEELKAKEEALAEQRKKERANQLEASESKKVEDAIRKQQILQAKLNEIKRTGNELDGEILATRLNISNKDNERLDQLEALIRSNDELSRSVENQRLVMDTVQDATKQLGDSLANNLADGLANGKLALDDFKNIARDFVSQLISEFIRLAVVNQIINSIFGLTGQAALPTASFGGGGATNTMRPMPRPNRATGGTVQPRMPTLVGERGPEIFIPNGGRVMNSNDTRSALSGGGSVVINQTLNVSTGVQDTVRAELVNFLPVVQAQTVAAVAQAKQKGGKFGSIL